MEWEKLISELVKYHRGKMLGVLFGLVFGLLTACFGFWRAFFIAFCIILGYTIGKKIDEHKSFKSLLEKFFED
jgi:uncharacterized membrane protein